MAAPGSTNALGDSTFKKTENFAVPCSQPPPEDGSEPVHAGSRTDMGALVLFLVSNWFVNGETVLIDGGVRVPFARGECTLTPPTRRSSSTRRRSERHPIVVQQD